jgi:hypothetical protein
MIERRPSFQGVSWMKVYGEPLLVVVAMISSAVLLAVILRPIATNRADFFTFWDAARWYREGVDPYLGHPLREGAGYNLNVPAFLFLFLPFSYLPLGPAFLAWTLAGFVACALAARQIAHELAIRSAFLVLCGLLVSQATFAAFQLGQVTPLLLPLFTSAWIADRNNRPWTAGVLLGVLMVAKPFLAVFGIYAALFRRSIPLLYGIAAGAVAILAVGLLAGGIRIYRSWLFVLQNVTWPAHLANGSLLALVTRALTPWGQATLTPPIDRSTWVIPIWYLTLGVVGAIAARALRKVVNRDTEWLIVGTCGFLLSPLGWAYYAPLLAGPLTAQWQKAPGSRGWLSFGFLCFCVPYSLLISLESPATSLFLGSVYTWGFLAWFVAGVTLHSRPVD